MQDKIIVFITYPIFYIFQWNKSSFETQIKVKKWNKMATKRGVYVINKSIFDYSIPVIPKIAGCKSVTKIKQGNVTIWKIPDKFKDLGHISFSLLHSFFHSCDDGVSLILGPMFGRLFRSPCETHYSGGAKTVLGCRGMRRDGPPPRVQVRNDHSRTSTWPEANYK